MKLATLNDGSRDGQLVVVSRDLLIAHYATGIANHLQQVLEDWNFYSPQLQDLYVALNQGKARHPFALDMRQCMAPLPRAFLFAVGNAYANPGVVTENQVGLRLAFADALHGACAPLTYANDKLEPDFAASLAVVTGDVPPAATPAQALESVRLLMLASHTHYRAWQDQAALALLAQPCTSFSPVAVTPDELLWGGETAWAQGRLNLTLQCSVNGRKLGLCEAGSDMTVSFGKLIASLCKTRGLRCGSVISTGEVRNLETSRGFCSIAAKRAQEATQHGSSTTPWLAQDDQVLIDMKGSDGQSVFGAIAQSVQVG
jgi:fumarylacetoacetate (FAA) hydrolase